MDAIFDIDGTLANATHRLHHIMPDPNKIYELPFKKDWETFLSDEMVAQDTAIPEVWQILTSLCYEPRNRILFITGRPEAQRQTTWNWLMDQSCEHRAEIAFMWQREHRRSPLLYMRKDGDRRPSPIVKEELLMRARSDGYNPVMAFEDRKEDTAMWRRNGLLCLQVAEGDY